MILPSRIWEIKSKSHDFILLLVLMSFWCSFIHFYLGIRDSKAVTTAPQEAADCGCVRFSLVPPAVCANHSKQFCGAANRARDVFGQGWGLSEEGLLLTSMESASLTGYWAPTGFLGFFLQSIEPLPAFYNYNVPLPFWSLFNLLDRKAIIIKT